MEPIKINALVLVDDDQSAHAQFVKAFEDYFQDNYDLKIFRKGQSLISYLEDMLTDPFGVEPFAILIKINPDSPSPYSLLETLKTHGTLKSYPVITYANSYNEEMVNECYDFHANAFIHLSPEDPSFNGYLNHFLDFWFSVVIPPMSIQEY
ncbi:MAG: hypothetical protein AAF502_17820 [Bacteroidota bacterium]